MMIHILSALIRFLYFIAGVCTLLLGLSYTYRHRRRKRWLHLLYGNLLLIILIDVGALVLSLPVGIWLDELQLKDGQRYRATDIEENHSDKQYRPIDWKRVKPISGNIMLDVVITRTNAGEEAFQNGDYDTAIRLFKYADSMISLAAIKARIADCYYYSGDYNNAIGYESQAISLNPDWSGPYYILGLCYLKIGMTYEASKALRTSCELGFRTACDLIKQLS